MNEELINDLTNGMEMIEFANKYCNGDCKALGKYVNDLENMGFNIKRKANTMGNIGFILDSDNKRKDFELLYDEDEFKVIIISDLHIGGAEDGLKYINDVYKYAKDNNIHVIFNIGDLFHGVNYKVKDNAASLFLNQLKKFNELYPFDKDVITFLILGNHDYVLFQSLGIDVSKCINDRTDFINLGYGLGKIRIGNDLLLLEHDLIFTEQPERDEHAKYIFRGHSHKYESVGNQITVPALQDAQFYANVTSVGFSEVTFKIENDSIKRCDVKQFDFKDGIRLINNFSYSKTSYKTKKLSI